MNISDIAQQLYESDFSSESSQTQVRYIFDHLVPFETFQSIVYDQAITHRDSHGKSVEIAKDLVSDGNEEFRSKNYDRAVTLFTTAIRVCPFPEDQSDNADLLSNCFARRSQAYYGLKDYDSALFDANHAYSLNPTPELLRYKEMCAQLSGATPQQAIDIKDPNLVYTQIRENINLNSDPIKGRCLETSVAIPINIQVLRETPFVGILYRDFLSVHCSHCFKRTGRKFWPCRTCDEVVFCDRQCAEAGMNGFHRVECGIAGMLSQLTPAVYMAFRSLVRVGWERAERIVEERGVEYQVLQGVSSVEWIDVYQAFTTLFDHFDSLDEHTKCNSLVDAIHFAFFMQFTNSFVGDDQSRFASLVSLIQLHQHKVEANAFEITFDTVRSHSNVGGAVAYLGSLFNHSCAPNVSYSWHNGSIVFVTESDVDSGGELIVSYGPVYTLADVVYRKQLLSLVYSFDCQCPPCVTEFAAHLALRCLHCSKPNVNYNGNTKTGNCLSCGANYENIEYIMEYESTINSFLSLIVFSAENDIEVDQYLRQIDGGLDRLSQYMAESSGVLSEIRTEFFELCSAIQRYDYSVKHGLLLLPKEMDQYFKDDTFQLLITVSDDYFAYLTTGNISDVREWRSCAEWHDYLIYVIQMHLISNSDESEEIKLNELLVRKTNEVHQLWQQINSLHAVS